MKDDTDTHLTPVQYESELTDELNLPVFKDTRSKAEKIGNIPKTIGQIRATGSNRSQPRPTVTVNMPKAPTQLVESPGGLTTAEKAMRLQARKLALDLCPEMLNRLFQLAMTEDSRGSSVHAAKVILSYGLGQPAVTHVDADGSKIMPSFTIVFGNQENIQQIEAQSFDLNENENEDE